MAMLSCYYGKDTDPAKLNKYLLDNNLYVQDDLIGGDDTLQKVYPDIKFEKDYFYQNTPADLSILHSLMDDRTASVILDIDRGNGHHHFVVCVGCNGVVTIANPWTGEVEEFSKNYGDPATDILKFVVYSSIPAQNQQAIQDDLRLARDKNWNLYQDSLQAKTLLNDELTEKEKAYNELDGKYQELTRSYADKVRENSELLTKMANDANKDSHVADQLLETTAKLQDHEKVFKEVANKLEMFGVFDSIFHFGDALIAKFEQSTIGQPTTPEPVKAAVSTPSDSLAVEKENETIPLLQAFRWIYGWLFVTK